MNNAVAETGSSPYDVVVTDIRMKGVDGIDVMHAARQYTPPPAVILLTGYGSVETAIAALRADAYDYLLKPCDTAELLRCVDGAVQNRLAELKRTDAINMLSRCVEQLQSPNKTHPSQPADCMLDITNVAEQAERFMQVGLLQLDLFRHNATFDEQQLQLTPIEYALLHCLAENPGRVFRYQDIVKHTHGSTVSSHEAQALLRAHIHNLRRKIDPDYLVNVRGIGYMLIAPEQPPEPDHE
jgi:DNA-binding response OmpR family regulator